MKPAWALPMAATVIAFALEGPWALAGAASGAFAAVLLRRAQAPDEAAWVAATAAPFTGVGPLALVPAAALALVLAAEHGNKPWLLLAALPAALLPGPEGLILATAGGAAFLAWGSWPEALLGALVVVPAVLHGWPAAAAAGASLAVAVVARAIAAHPANATMARRLVQAGLLALPAPAVVAAAGWSVGHAAPEFRAMLLVAGIAAAWGVLLLGAHLGAALLLRATGPSPAVWLTWAWCTATLAALLLVVAPNGAFHAAPALWGLALVPGALAVPRVLPRPVRTAVAKTLGSGRRAG